MLTCPTDQCDDPTFDMMTTAYLSFDVDTDPMQATADLTGLSHEDIAISCVGCGHEVERSRDLSVAQVVALIRVHKRHAMPLPLFSGYDLQGTEVEPNKITEPRLRDVSTGAAYQKAVEHQEKYTQWLSAQEARISRGEIDVRDLHTMRGGWREASERHLAALLAELAS
ncbi:hypothetical protein [Streptomyces sp. NBC_01451]|uniref:hypothetical protein n=1 Tax=Streptomyces sp. NBC_01451 TaxID=2903872 RepID=UPI002E30414B|nr:hypothetical protein [Streptomyces sp. NBC_01451]